MITKEVQIFDKEAMTAEMCIETALAALTVSPTSASSVQGGVALNTPTTSSLASDDDHAGRYFSMFEDFVPVHTASLQQEFGRLAVSKGWRKKSAEWKEQRLQCLRMEYDHFVGQLDMSKLDIWQSLCVEIAGVQDPPTSITQCKKLLGRFHVNIFDYINCKRAGKKVEPVFTNFGQFLRRTTGNRVFPL